MTIKDVLISKKILSKLINVSFDSPTKNLKIMKFVNKADEYLSFLDNERNKIIKKYGIKKEEKYILTPDNVEKSQSEINEILSTEITDLPDLGISIEDFETCYQGKEKENWLSASDMLIVQNIIENQKSED